MGRIIDVSGCLGAALLVLAACGGAGGGDDFPDGYGALNAPPTFQRDVAPLDMDRALAVLPDGFELNWEEIAQEGSHTRLTGVELRPDAGAALAFTAQSLDVWGLDLDALETLKAGDWVAGETRLVERLDARGLSVSGLEMLYAPLLDEMNAATAPLQALDPEMPDPAVTLEEYSVTLDRLVLAGLDVHPLEKAVDGDAGYAGDRDGLAVQHGAALVRAFELEAAAMTGMQASMSMTQYGATSQMQFAADFTGYRGYSRGDLASADVAGLSFEMEMPMPPPGGFEPGAGPSADGQMMRLDMAGEAEGYRVSQIAMSNLLDMLAHGVAPPADETDLMSLGLWEVDRLNYTLEGEPWMTMDSAVFDARGFHWLAPADISFEIKGFSYDFAAYMPVLMAAAPEEFEGHEETARKVVAALERHDLTGPYADISGAWKWVPETGMATLDFEQVTHGHSVLRLDADGRLPAWDALAPHLDFSAGEPSAEDSAALEAAFRSASALTAMEIELSDEGGLDKLFNGAVDVARALPQDIPQVKAFATYEPDQLRTMLSGMMLVGIGQVSKEFPPVRQIGDVFVDFIEEGGTVRLSLAPDTPLTAARFETYSTRYPDPEPEQVIEFLGFKAEHIAQ